MMEPWVTSYVLSVLSSSPDTHTAAEQLETILANKEQAEQFVCEIATFAASALSVEAYDREVEYTE
ncbi:hypothetical protein HK104_001889 [Borealophlyctis nickersoniae]|nr:hypothetical protein HK104_001889 [Borealophlyctis nickersoniae]